MRITVVGAGSWGTALAEVASRCHHEVLLWAHDPKVAEAIARTRSNPIYLPACQLDAHVRVTSSLEDAARFSETLLMATPSHHYREVLSTLLDFISGDVRVVSATKGIENESLKRMSEISAEILGERLVGFAVLSGPTFAVEVSRGDPTAAVVASSVIAFAEEMQVALSSRTFRLYRSDDVAGVEFAGSLKNIIAIAAGVLDGIGLGSNTMAALVTRGLFEIRRLGVALGGKPETFMGLAGMGDLILTATGGLSRNRSVGIALGQGRSIDSILGS
ncbi:MAG TPA: NAD(P)H-dependent glycerol-3-phosphate dehydrogenase, partial [Thermoanaerobaculia bacterium]